MPEFRKGFFRSICHKIRKIIFSSRKSLRHHMQRLAVVGVVLSLSACVTKSTYLKQVQTADQLAAQKRN